MVTADRRHHLFIELLRESKLLISFKFWVRNKFGVELVQRQPQNQPKGVPEHGVDLIARYFMEFINQFIKERRLQYSWADQGLVLQYCWSAGFAMSF